ncbi:unnamed protein product [Caenorhabditis auriculariae]|uniref:Uncharacterized protein n=1 Tax=Caenorhabditis auriculariae TaxID=2777116 RepID=A0A8S1HDV0_9PELO|nr:unnamed protein product [Caenorhabditis auriculariae]
MEYPKNQSEDEEKVRALSIRWDHSKMKSAAFLVLLLSFVFLVVQAQRLENCKRFTPEGARRRDSQILETVHQLVTEDTTIPFAVRFLVIHLLDSIKGCRPIRRCPAGSSPLISRSMTLTYTKWFEDNHNKTMEMLRR